nr:hypothetical protein [Tanacetum cinerariifolium]
MATMIEQQVALDEAFVPSAQRHSLLRQMYLKYTCRNSRQQLMFINTPSDSKGTLERTLSIWKHFGRCCISVLGFRANLLLSYCLKRKSFSVLADLSEMELKKILIDKMEGNKSIQVSDEQRNLYKALVKAYEADMTILDSYRESAILKRRREDDDDQEGPSAGSDRGSKRRREGGEHASASTPFELATRSTSRSTTGTQSRQLSAKEPVQTTCQMKEPSHLVFETGAEDQPIVQTS